MSDASLGRRFTEWSRREPRDIDWKDAGRMTGSERVKRLQTSPFSLLIVCHSTSKEGARSTSQAVPENPAYAK
jgi:hypothetical protein